MTWTWKRLLSSYHHLFVLEHEDICMSSRFYNTQKWTNLDNWAQLRLLRTHSSRPASQSQTSCPTSGADETTEQRLTISFPAMRGLCEQIRWNASPRSNQSTRSTQSPWSRWTGKKSRWSRLVGTIIIIIIITRPKPAYGRRGLDRHGICQKFYTAGFSG